MQIAGFLNDRPWAAWNPFHTDQYSRNKHKSNDDIPKRGTAFVGSRRLEFKAGREE